LSLTFDAFPRRRARSGSKEEFRNS